MSVPRKRKKTSRKWVRVGGEIRVNSYVVLQDLVRDGVMAFLLNDKPHAPRGKTDQQREADAAEQARLAVDRIMILAQEYFVFSDPYTKTDNASRRKR